MKTIIIDDEQTVRNGLSKMLKLYCTGVELVGEANGVVSGAQAIRALHPDLIFLDIRMEDGSGLELLSHFPERLFHVIFITAHNQYAVDAFRLSAVDYLLKPVDPDDLVVAVEKAKQTIERENLTLKFAVLMNNLESISKGGKKMVLKDSTSMHIVDVEEIIRCHAEGSYTRFFLHGGKEILVSRNLKEYEVLLKEYGFFRPHHSHLVNLNQITRFDRVDGGILVMKDKSMLPVSVRKKEKLLELLAMF